MTPGRFQRGPLLAGGAVVVAASAAVAFLVVRLHEHGHEHAAAADGGETGPGVSGDLHAWMHRRLHLTPEQEAALRPLEDRFAARRAELEASIAAAATRLADAVVTARSADDDAVTAALDELETLRSELHRETLDHLLAMKAELDDRQAERLLDWIHDSILHATLR